MSDCECLFGYFEGVCKIILVELQVLLIEVLWMLGFDGQKMFKLYGNMIGLCEDVEMIMKKVCMMLIDFVCVCCIDLGDFDKCLVWQFYQVYMDEVMYEWVQKGCCLVGIGCFDCKQLVVEGILCEQQLMFECVQKYMDDLLLLCVIVVDGCDKVCKYVMEMMCDVCDVMGLLYN